MKTEAKTGSETSTKAETEKQKEHVTQSALDARMFVRLLSRLAVLENKAVVRNYSNGVWQQYSGKDFVGHLGRSARGWQKEYDGLERHSKRKGTRPCLMCLGQATYSEWMTSYGALLEGLDVFFAPEQLSDRELTHCIDYFAVTGIIIDSHMHAERFKDLGIPVYHMDQKAWAACEKQGSPQAVQIYRELELERRKSSAENSEFKLDDAIQQARSPGDLLFVSIGNDGFHKKVRLSLNSFMVTAQNFLLHLDAPSWFEWKTIELVPLAHPFAHTARLAVLLKNGVIGFRNADTDWPTNLSILRPTCLFAGPAALSLVASHVTDVRRSQQFHSRVAMSEGLSRARKFFEGGRSFRLSSEMHATLSNALRAASQLLVGKKYRNAAVGDVKFIVHGLAAAQKSQVRVLERLGVPVIETYGKTAACGIMASNTYSESHLNLIGSPLAHVQFRLGADSILEYRLVSEHFEDHSVWIPSGDVAQMTPFGFAITGRKHHQIITRGGIVISPAAFEWKLTDTIVIEQACIIGDRLPFLAALLVLSPEARAVYSKDPSAVRDKIEEVVARVNETLPRDGTIKKFEILTKPFREADGEILPNGAVNRVRILETRAAEIAALYATTNSQKS